MGNCFSKGDNSKPSEKSPLAGKASTQNTESKPQNYNSTSGVTEDSKPKTEAPKETSPKKTASVPKEEASSPLIKKTETPVEYSSESTSPVDEKPIAKNDEPIVETTPVVEPEPVKPAEPEPVESVDPEPVESVDPEPVQPEPTKHVEPEPIAEPEPTAEPEPIVESEPIVEPVPEPTKDDEQVDPEPVPTTAEKRRSVPPEEPEPELKHQKVDVCETCQTPLKPGQFASYEGKNYCKPHFKQLFMTGKVVAKQPAASPKKETPAPAPATSMKDRLMKYAQEEAPSTSAESPKEAPVDKRVLLEKKISKSSVTVASPSSGSELINSNIVTAVGVTWNGNFPARKTMEDEHKVVDFENYIYCGVYDGHGGRDVVDFIKENLHQNIQVEEEDFMLKGYLKTEQMLVENAVGVDNVNMGTTSTSCVVRLHEDGSKSLHVGNIGDSRAVLIRNGEAVQVTYEHRPSDEQEVQRIKDAKGWVVRNRVAGLLAVTRSFGHAEIKQWVLSEPFVYDTKLEDGDDYLIIACDGLWDTISNQDAANLVLKESESGADVQKISEALVKYALDAKTTDNVTVMVVKI